MNKRAYQKMKAAIKKQQNGKKRKEAKRTAKIEKRKAYRLAAPMTDEPSMMKVKVSPLLDAIKKATTKE
jgi:hypothetical protein